VFEKFKFGFDPRRKTVEVLTAEDKVFWRFRQAIHAMFACRPCFLFPVEKNQSSGHGLHLYHKSPREDPGL